MRNDLLLGTHVSAAGGMYRACERGAQIGCTAIQVFTKNANQWAGTPITDEDVRTYKTALAKSSIAHVVAHAAYLINLCAANPLVLQKSREGLTDELHRCERFGIDGLVVHPGSHMGKGEEEGIRQIAESINLVHHVTPDFRVRTLLETTAGQGSAVGYRFEHLRDILGHIDLTDRMAVCIDTCHLFAAGYPIHTSAGWEETMQKFHAVIGSSSLALVHVNDSGRAFGTRVDRHEHIGKGQIGLEGFRALMNDPRLAGIPKILETEKSDDMHEDVENMTRLKSLVVPV